MERQKLTIKEALLSRRIKKPNFTYNVLGTVWNVLFTKKYGLHVVYKKDIRKVKEPHIMISNHASRLDYIFVGAPLLPKRYNFVAGHNEFYRSHLQGVFKLLNVIPKRNFTSDVYTIRQIKNIIEDKGNIIIFPEGMSSISGANQPVAIGTGKLIKHFCLPVYYSVIKGGYLTSPKYNLEERHGRVEVVIDQMFTKEEIEKLTPEEIEDIINEKIYHDDYAWNKIHKYTFKNNGNIAKDLEDLLYWCPRCDKEFKMTTRGNIIECEECGNGASIDDTYELHPLNDTCIIPETQTVWFNMEREKVKKEIKNPNFELKEEVDLGILPKYDYLKNQATSEIVGRGVITLNRDGFTYKGTMNGEEFSFHLSTNEVPTYGMCTDLSRFYTFYQGDFYEFYPKHRTVEKWFLATEELHRLNGGKWKDFKFKK